MRAAGRGIAIALFVLVMAITPLSAFTSGGFFETWTSDGFGQSIRVTLNDHTGLVRAIAPRLSESASQDPRVLTVDLVAGCGGYWANLDFRRLAEGYVVEHRVDRIGCPFLNLVGYGGVAITLWAPLDVSTVQVVGHL